MQPIIFLSSHWDQMEAPICWQGSVLHSAYDSRISPVWMPVYPNV
ncbi:hypothetical protein P4V52_11520 [Brevibacillus formosus]|nr:hypothetical protein [Brevibacillus formosus]